MVAGREMNASRRLESRKKLWVAELGEVGEEQGGEYTCEVSSPSLLILLNGTWTQATNHSGEKNMEKVVVEVRNSTCPCALHLKLEEEQSCLPITLDVSSEESVAFTMQTWNFDQDKFFWCLSFPYS